ncbi:MAG: DUF4926 domain-containing protein, partial [Acidimicrobiales bacterium]
HRNPMMHEHDAVVLTRDLPEHWLRAGDVGAVVHVHASGRAFEGEFVAGEGRTVTVLTLESGDVRGVTEAVILHARAFS